MDAAQTHEKQTAKVDESQLLPKTTFCINNTKLYIQREIIPKLTRYFHTPS